MARYVFICSFLLLSSGLLWAKISVNVPSGLSNYEVVDRLEAYGCASTTLRSLHPQSHADLLSSLVFINPQKCAAPEWLLRERELMLRPVRQNDASAGLHFLPEDLLPLLGTEGVVTPLFSKGEGRTSYPGVSLVPELNFNAEAGNQWGIAFSGTPGANFVLDRYRYLAARFYFHEIYVKAGYRRLELTWGRLQQRFGEMKHGELILSGATKPIDLIKLAIRPHLLGYPFSVLGPVTLDTWVGSGGNSSFVQNTKLWAVELGLRPFTFYEFALIEMYQFSGTGMQNLESSDVLNMLVYSNADSLSTRRHRGMGIYQGLWGPDHFVKLYAEFFFDRLTAISNWLSQDITTSVGLWFPMLRAWDLRLEFVNTVPHAYSNTVWRQGWVVERTPLGNALGEDATGFYVDLGMAPLDDWRPVLGFSYEKRNASQAVAGTVPELRYGGSLEVKRRWEALEFQLALGFQHVKGYQYFADLSQNLFGTNIELRYSLF